MPGMPASLADQIRSLGDLSSTMPIPIPTSLASSHTADINGAPGLVIGDTTNIASGVIWQSHGLVYGVAGTLSDRQVVAVARSMHATIRRNIAEAEEATAHGNFDRRAEVHLEFHRILARMTGNPIMVIVMDSVLKVLRHFILSIGDYENAFVLPSRKRFMKCLEARDADGAVAEMEIIPKIQQISVGRITTESWQRATRCGDHAAGLKARSVEEFICDSGKACAVAANKTGESAFRPVDCAGDVVDVVAGVFGGKRPARSSRLIRYDIPAGVVQLVKRAIEVVFVAQSLGNCSVVRSGEHTRLRRQPSHNVIAVTGGSGLIRQRGEMADGVCTGIISVSYNGRSQRAALRAIAFARYTMQRVIAEADRLHGRAGLVRRWRGLVRAAFRASRCLPSC